MTPQCFTCDHYNGKGRCDAYRDIPIEVMANQHDHRKPYKGDGGVRFKPLPKAG